MYGEAQDNAATMHNAAVTARPRIMFPVIDAVDELRRRILGKTAHWREFTGDFFQLSKTPTPQRRELEAEMSKENWEKLRALTLLRCAYSAEDPLSRQLLAQATRLLLSDYPGDEKEYFRTVEDMQRIARSHYAAILDEELKRARIEIGIFVPEIRCPNITVAAFAFAAYQRISVCLNCQKLFALDVERVDGSNSEKYCTAACGQRFRQRSYRLRVKQAAESKSKRKGKGR